MRKLFPILLVALVRCSSVQQSLDTAVFYKRDILLEINGKSYVGVTVVPKSQSYDIKLIPPGEIDLMLLRSCHREFSVEKADTGWSLFGNKKKSYVYKYTPIHGLEDNRVCPLRIDIYESEKGRQSWALLDFESPDYTVDAEITCNGETKSMRGVGVCQSKEQTIQRIKFQEPVRFAPTPVMCNAPKKVGDLYEIKTAVGECLFTFDTRDGRTGRLINVGYSGVLVREAQ